MELLWVLMYSTDKSYNIFKTYFITDSGPCTEIIDVLARGVLPNNQNPGVKVLVSCQEYLARKSQELVDGGHGVVCFVLAVGRCGVEVAIPTSDQQGPSLRSSHLVP